MQKYLDQKDGGPPIELAKKLLVMTFFHVTLTKMQLSLFYKFLRIHSIAAALVRRLSLRQRHIFLLMFSVFSSHSYINLQHDTKITYSYICVSHGKSSKHKACGGLIFLCPKPDKSQGYTVTVIPNRILSCICMCKYP
jgi:hypothetical protein